MGGWQIWVWDALAASAGGITAILAWLVYREASRIRRIEWASLTNNRWQAFNQILIETDLAGRWEKLRSAQIAIADITAADKRLLLMYFNNMLVEYDADGLGLLAKRTREAVGAGIRKSVIDFRPYEAFLIPLLAENGFHEGFTQYARDVWSAAKPHNE